MSEVPRGAGAPAEIHLRLVEHPSNLIRVMPAKGRTRFSPSTWPRTRRLAAAGGEDDRMVFQATVVQKELEEAGFDTKLAYGITAVPERDVVGELEGKVVTKEYLDSRLDAKVAELRAEMIK